MKSIEEKVCSACQISKPVTQFYQSLTYKGGRGYRCKDCDKLARAAYKNKNFEKEKAVRRKAQLKLKYNLSPEVWDSMCDEQKGVCAICKGGPVASNIYNQRLVVDHDHATGDVRGLLCQRCNKALGLFKDDPEVLQAAINYLTQRPEIH